MQEQLRCKLKEVIASGAKQSREKNHEGAFSIILGIASWIRYAHHKSKVLRLLAMTIGKCLLWITCPMVTDALFGLIPERVSTRVDTFGVIFN